MERVVCYTAGCNNCEHAEILRKKRDGTIIYSCGAFPKKHPEINARDCVDFICTGCNKGMLSTICENGV